MNQLLNELAKLVWDVDISRAMPNEKGEPNNLRGSKRNL